jgi:hypothetical protein
MLLTAAATYVLNASRMGSQIRSGSMMGTSATNTMRKTHGSLFNSIRMLHPQPIQFSKGTSAMDTLRPKKAGGAEGEAAQAQAEAQAAESRGFVGDVGEMLSSSSSELSTKSATMSTPLFIIALLIFVLYYIGLCTFWSRANPNVTTGLRILVYVLLFFFGEFYLIYVIFRFTFFGLTRREDKGYATLHKPTPYFSGAKL